MAQTDMQRPEKPETKRPAPPPVVGVRIKKTTAEVIRAFVPAQGGGSRGKITEISKASIKNAVEVLTNSDPELNSMLVCTYPGDAFPDDGRVVKCHHARMLAAIGRKFGNFSFFSAFEFQKRGAPHFHVGLSFDLRDMGDVARLKRYQASRRKPAFETVKSVQDWAFFTWISIIKEPDPKHKGEKLDWIGLDSHDIAMMHKAYFQYNAGFSWEVMREKSGATRYFVKELTGLKQYQKQIPDWYQNPGRPFAYSSDMRFDENEAIEFEASDAEIRQLLEQAGWQYLPESGKPLFKRLWNAAALLAGALIEAGARPIETSLAALRRFADLRSQRFMDKFNEIYQQAGWDADVEHWLKAKAYWESRKRRFAWDDRWDYTFNTGPP